MAVRKSFRQFNRNLDVRIIPLYESKGKFAIRKRVIYGFGEKQLKIEMNPQETLGVMTAESQFNDAPSSEWNKYFMQTMAFFKYKHHHNNILDSRMEEWDPASNDFVFRCNSCWRTNSDTKIIRTSREKYYCLDCLATFDLCQG